MAVADSSIDYPVYLGLWTNWSKGGRISGSVVTINHRNGNLLTAFLALFVAFASSRLWRIASFVLHQVLSKRVPRDGLYHQRQAILRNAPDEKTAVVRFIRILWAWRSVAARPFSRLLPLVALAASVTVGFALGGIFSSKISTIMGSEVLISSSECGTLPWNLTSPVTSEEVSNIYQAWASERVVSWANYAQRCYSNESKAGDCQGPYLKKSLSSSVDRNGHCPFKNEICLNTKGNLIIDTGYLNSQADFGFNGPQNLQYNIRILTHCAPLKTKGYKKTTYYSLDKPYTQYFYGTRIPEVTQNRSSCTYEMPQQSIEETDWEYHFIPSYDYRIEAYYSYVYNGSVRSPVTAQWSNWFPIDDLLQTDGDVILFSLSANGIRFTEPVDDAWYSAHRISSRNVSYPDYSASAVYYADDTAPALGCKIQYQTCDPTLPTEQGCSPWGGWIDIGSSINPSNSGKAATIYWLQNAILPIEGVVLGLKVSALTSRYRLSEGIQASLPANQWQLEVENWNSISLASLQGTLLEYAIGPGDPAVLENFWVKPSNAGEKHLCQNQKIISAAYTNFSMMWLMIIFILGALVILLEQSLEHIVVWLEKRGTIGSSTLEWFGNDTLQLQRMAHEELELGHWSNCTGPSIVPITKKGQLLAIYDSKNPEHPRLINPVTVSNEPEAGKKPDESGSPEGQSDGNLADSNHDPVHSPEEVDVPSSQAGDENIVEPRNSRPNSVASHRTSSRESTAITHAQSAEQHLLASHGQLGETTASSQTTN